MSAGVDRSHQLCYAERYADAYAMLCYAMLCYAMLLMSYAMLCYAMLCYAMLCYAMLCYAMLCWVSSTALCLSWIEKTRQYFGASRLTRFLHNTRSSASFHISHNVSLSIPLDRQIAVLLAFHVIPPLTFPYKIVLAMVHFA